MTFGDYFLCEMDVSRSGRIRKKNSKLADFESPDEIDTVVPSKRPKGQSFSMKSYVIDSTMPPDQLLADGDEDTFQTSADIDVEATEHHTLMRKRQKFELSTLKADLNGVAPIGNYTSPNDTFGLYLVFIITSLIDEFCFPKNHKKSLNCVII